MKKLQDIKLGEWIDLEKSIFHLSLVSPKNYDEQLNLIGNNYLQKWLFYNKEARFENMSEEEIKKAIVEYAEYELNLQDEISKVEYYPKEDIDFNNELWNIVPPPTVDGLEGFERIQRLALILSDLQDNKVEALAELCCHYLVRLWNGENISTELAKELPLPIVFKVRKYVDTSIDIYNAYGK